MPSKPTTLPRWATNPPAAPPTTITEPSESVKNVGWQPGNPTRQFMNWLQNKTYQWLEWLDAAGFRLDDLVEDFVHPDPAKTAAPVAGPGLTNTTGQAIGYIGGYRSELELAAKLYQANQDRYIDLTQGGGFSETAVGVGDPAPAVPSDHIRLWKVRTDATDVTLVENLAQTQIRWKHDLYMKGVLRTGLGQTSQALAELAASVFPATAPIDDVANQRAALVWEIDGSAVSRLSGGQPLKIRLYKTNKDGLFLTVNAKFENAGAAGSFVRSASNGDNEDEPSWLLEVNPQGNNFDLRYHPASSPDTWDNVSWVRVDIKHDFGARETQVWQTLVLGAGMLETEADRMLPRLRRLFAATGSGTVNRTLLDYSVNTDGTHISKIRRYRAMVADPQDNHRMMDERTGNAEWDESTQQWALNDATSGGVREVFSADGMSWFTKAATGAPFATSGWTRALFLPTVGDFLVNRNILPRQTQLFDLGNVSNLWRYMSALAFDAQGLAPSPITASDKNRTYADRMVKASAFISVSRSGSPTAGFVGVGVASVTVIGGVTYRGFAGCNAVEIVFDNEYAWKSIGWSFGYPGSSGQPAKQVTLERIVTSLNPLTVRIFELGGHDPSTAAGGGSFVDLSGDLPTLEIDINVTGRTP